MIPFLFNVGLCSLTLPPGNGVISSPNYPRPYLASKNCSWIIPDGYKAKLKVKHLALNSGSGCEQSYLSIATTTMSLKICTLQNISSSVRFTGAKKITFQSKENYGNFTGFYAEYFMEGK